MAVTSVTCLPLSSSSAGSWPAGFLPGTGLAVLAAAQVDLLHRQVDVLLHHEHAYDARVRSE